MSNADSEQAALDVLTGFMDALNARDSMGMRAHFHFPHYRMAGTDMTVFETPEDYGIDTFLGRTDTPGWSHSRWDRRKVVHSRSDKVHLDVQFSRYRPDQTLLGQYESLWVVIKRHGRWGVVSRSSYAA